MKLLGKNPKNKYRRAGTVGITVPYDDTESSRAKPPEKGPFVPLGERAQIKIIASGHSLLLGELHLLARSGYFYSAWFSRSKRFSPKIGLFRQIFPAEVHKTLWDQEKSCSLARVGLVL